MGVRFLNNLIKKMAPGAMRYVPLSHYRGQTIVVDTSIYMHKYLGSNSLMESMYFMISQFKYLRITPIFIFDGAAPVEKRGVLNARENVRQSAIQRYNNLSRILDDKIDGAEPVEPVEPVAATTDAAAARATGPDDGTNMDVDEINRRMQSLKKRFMRISNYEINEMKRLMREYGVQYIESAGESDLLCAHLVKSGVAQVCMSDDMDLFLYGCPVVLRHVNIWYGTGVEYTLSEILNDMGISLQGFRMACVLSGTDYTFSDTADASERRRDETDDSDLDPADRNIDSCNGPTGSGGSNSNSNSGGSRDVIRRMFRIYLSDLVKYYLEYKYSREREYRSANEPRADGDDDIIVANNSEPAFDDGFYDWVTATHLRGGRGQRASEKELKMAKAMFQRAFAIFSSHPSDTQSLCMSKVQVADTSVSLNHRHGSDAEEVGCQIPHKVKRIMAKYNFIYI
jgi:5'-3' exonuclease